MSKEINDDFMVTVFAFVIMHTVTLPSLLKAPNLDGPHYYFKIFHENVDDNVT